MSNQRPFRIILGITGGIAAYKSPDLVRRLRAEGAEVQVVMTPSGEKMVSPAVFQAVSGRAVRGDLWDAQAEDAMGHIELARWADLVLVAPATANIMAQIASGTASGLLTTLCLATKAPLLLAPAMNQAMWLHPATQANLQLLAERGVGFIGPADGEQACGEVGPGRMVEPQQIVAALSAELSGVSQCLAGLSILITAGPTREPIDPVRYVSNRSSGKMGFALAHAATAAGAKVKLVAGPVSLETPVNVERIDVESAEQMRDATLTCAPDADIYIGAAAIADYRPEFIPEQKIKKQADTMDVHMVKSVDVLAEVAALEDGPFTVGFAAETEKLEEYALAKLVRKNLDMIIANLVGTKLCFDCEDNSVLVLWQEGRKEYARMLKSELAARLLTTIAERYRVANP
ncbi:MAG: bifunctional phosphopantothenoylcysteine decarboxylase/phosphopantothenate--cysteine ligase CoaBC [Gammaproteobacteria bacterium]|jgi:phosphopantothenoylcysteine decarboxylase/phosphopantothenate--cysteine ligase|nr:bifunctional phosphopantothenoylcysteine decarboxylase/phosphopantothenate--cysteine ligase CoaBC [Chromatiales bacterium]MDP7297253.1 bifunctional phosphopantothenoylcysteine decarboxylase/phosphopantothenate--cysteine ligase CoaBC [Gammaproteobacteria bacterium]MDP7419781.1 bifunctional phosphopantothenoylcysteine decarboxylase/phosphopantothenate--cysteine ligase CoaBC [Gammaproteobacteria bacterium]MDP7659651.1 bifunctional phosphopantothenoylcysteine decarboxylase/phosphopantothenate--cy